MIGHVCATRLIIKDRLLRRPVSLFDGQLLCPLPFLYQEFLQLDRVLGVAAPERIRYIAEEGNETNKGIDNDVHHHFTLGIIVQVFDLAASAVDHQGHEYVQGVA